MTTATKNAPRARPDAAAAPCAEPQAESRAQHVAHALRVRGEELLVTVRKAIHEGNVRRIIVKGENEHTLLEIPVTAGIVSAMMAPALVAVGAIAALAKHYTVIIQKDGDAAG